MEDDLFGTQFLPIAEATPGDYIALRINDGKVFFISHDFDTRTEKSHYEIAESLDKYVN